MLQETGHERSENTDHQQDAEGLKGLIAKLRWAGMDKDAEKLCQELEACAPADCLAPGPHETD